MSDPELHPMRQLGPTAWAVLEVLGERTTRDHHGELVVEISIRVLAAELGLAKNTVHRALRHLARCGLVDACQPRTSAGTFSRGHYVLTTNSVVDARPVIAPPVSAPARRDSAPRSPVAANPIGQLSLEI